jgi:hypothetical protein
MRCSALIMIRRIVTESSTTRNFMGIQLVCKAIGRSEIAAGEEPSRHRVDHLHRVVRATEDAVANAGRTGRIEIGRNAIAAAGRQALPASRSAPCRSDRWTTELEPRG